MAGVNKVIIIGNLGRDPEVRAFPNGGKVVSLRLATSERYKDKAGEMQERTEWHAVSIFNEKLGEVAEKYLRKGSEVYLEGQIETRKWTDKDGAEKYSMEIVLRQFRGELCLIGGKAQGGDEREERTAPRGGATAAPRQSNAQRGADMDDDIPFSPEFR